MGSTNYGVIVNSVDHGDQDGIPLPPLPLLPLPAIVIVIVIAVAIALPLTVPLPLQRGKCCHGCVDSPPASL